MHTLIIKALRKAAGSLSLYLLVTRHPPRIVAALLANVNYAKINRIIINNDTNNNKLL